MLAIRASAAGPVPDAGRLVPRRALAEAASGEALQVTGVRPVWDDELGTFVGGARVYRWDELLSGHEPASPAVVEGIDSTAWIPTGATATVDETGGLLMSCRQPERGNGEPHRPIGRALSPRTTRRPMRRAGRSSRGGRQEE